jgi:histidinol phosphatase-like enzyme
VFFDRDGTLIEEEHYLSDPERVRLRAGAVAAVDARGRSARRVLA